MRKLLLLEELWRAGKGRDLMVGEIESVGFDGGILLVDGAVLFCGAGVVVTECVGVVVAEFCAGVVVTECAGVVVTEFCSTNEVVTESCGAGAVMSEFCDAGAVVTVFCGAAVMAEL
eukprot:TRINITY_DN3556_c0_g4_i1.p1 TRINITY_DN3556_c0_g4~~TRINITY_DN3556_c0_g4_i1.p1  ORF type:complete len:117 (-),score=40.41 TRINITY_DN3556_c0_g4_i1:807-1157(-)